MCTRSSLNRLSLLIVLLALYSCKKSDSPNNNPSPSYIPAVTPIGTPVGNPVSKTIGSSGGSLVSPDGRMELNIPAGALSSNTDISIQPVTNEAPGGIGLSYHLMPDGTKFAKPVTLTYHYTDKEINGTLPYLLYIAYQDSLLQWRADFKKRNVDTIAKTASLGISHFSDWAMGDRLAIAAAPYTLHKNETSQLRAIIQSPPVSTSGSDDDLPSLPSNKNFEDNEVSNWKVNGKPGGNSQDGTISGTGSQVNYKAPASIDKTRTVQISAEINRAVPVYNNGKEIFVNKLILFNELTLEPEIYNYHLFVELKITFQTTFTSTYLDSAELDINVNNDVVTISHIINKAPHVSPSFFTIPGGCDFSWLPGPIGELNITGGDGYTGTGPSNEKVFGFDLHQGNLEGPGSDIVCPGGPTSHTPPSPVQTDNLGAQFDLKEQGQIVKAQTIGQATVTFTLMVR